MEPLPVEGEFLVDSSEEVLCFEIQEEPVSDFEQTVQDLQNATAKLLSSQSSMANNEQLPSIIFSDNLADSDGFTSESSDTTGIVLRAKLASRELLLNAPTFLEEPSTSTFAMIESVIDTMSSNISDSDTGSIVTNTTLKIKDDPLAFQSGKLPIKKRGGWPKGRKRKPELLHLPPKAPSTGYNLYLNDQRKLFKNTNLRFHEVTKLIGNKWSSLSLEEKKPYLERAEEEKKRYREEFRNYRQSRAYQLYLANKRKKRTQHNVLSESDMDATDEVDEEDNEELYCRTCDQWFHNHHNKREHLQGKQHMQSVAGAISKELKYDSDCGGSTSNDATSTSATAVSNNDSNSSSSNMTIEQAMSNLMEIVKKREAEYKCVLRENREMVANHTALLEQLSSLKERESKLQKDLIEYKSEEKELDLKLFHLWKVPSLFIVTELSSNEDYIDLV